MKIYRIGSSGDADIVVDHDSASREHADLIAATDGSFYWIDRNSTNGSFRRENGKWVRFSKAFLTGAEPIRIGLYETTIKSLLGNEAIRGGAVERGSDGIPRARS